MSINKKQNRTVRRSMTIESMESRELFAADLGFGQITGVMTSRLMLVDQPEIELSNGVLSVEGTDANDNIRIEQIQTTFQATIPSVASKLSPGSLGISTAQLTIPQIKVTVTDASGDVLDTATFNRNLVNSLTVRAEDGNDVVSNLTNLTSTMFGGDGHDTMQGGTGVDTIYGQNGSDTIRGGRGNDVLYGHNGNDKMYGQQGDDRMYGGSGDDYMNGGSGDDRMNGDWGNDRQYGESGDDEMYGGSGNDYQSGGSGSDTMFGNSGSDSMYGGNQNDEMDGGSGNDAMYGGNHNDEMNGGSGNDAMYGESGNDTMRGGSGNDALYGSWGNDNLYGGSGNDFLNAGSGDDGLFGGTGTDSLTGSSGDDRFLVVNDVPTYFLGIQTGMTTADNVVDENSNDALINFEDGEGRTMNFSGGRWAEFADGSFTMEEIEKVDTALADLHHQIGNTKLLKRENGNEITFERLGEQIDGNFGVGGVNGGSKITLVDNTFDSTQDWVSQVVFHEIGHNWDNENDNWGEWKDISGWQDTFFWPWESSAGLTLSDDGDWYYESNARFARDYGRTNPMEDFATYFTKVMMDENDLSFGGSGQQTSTAKENFIDDFFASLS